MVSHFFTFPIRDFSYYGLLGFDSENPKPSVAGPCSWWNKAGIPPIR